MKSDGSAELLHGGDYNPDQWLDAPGVLSEDIRLMREAEINSVSMGIFAWSAIEPEEGRYEFDWLDERMDAMAENGIKVVLATPSGARPAWMDAKYPEVLRVGPSRVRNLHGLRHNHNYSSPVFREKVTEINTKLAERYGTHPALYCWHISNEYGGEDHSEASQEAFRRWLRDRYADSLDALNKAWWSSFWSHTYTDWNQIESPAPHGERAHCSLLLDWRRFVTYQTIDFMRVEIAPLCRITPDVPITTNFMGTYPGLDYFKFRSVLDIASWDSYPTWHMPEPAFPSLPDFRRAADTSFSHDLTRSILDGKPFLLMESTPSVTNWQPASKLKRPGMHLTSSLLAVAHGSDSVQYFQWRKSRGSSEKFHGAVVDHVGHENTRVFRDVASVGKALRLLAPIAGGRVDARVAVVFDWENRWAIEGAQGPIAMERRAYEATCRDHYFALWRRGVAIDVIDSDCGLDRYKLVVAPMLYMVKPGVAERLEAFVREGGTLVLTYWSGIVDESDLCFLGGFPGPLRHLAGIWAEEIDALAVGEENSVDVTDESLPLAGSFRAFDLCERIHPETADVIGRYRRDFYAGEPAITVNRVGNGSVYYQAARLEHTFLSGFYANLIRRAAVPTPVPAGAVPEGIAVSSRFGGDGEYVFLQNFSDRTRTVAAPDGEVVVGPAPSGGRVTLDAYETVVLRRELPR